MERKKILVVCLGNICRSPIAEGLFQKSIDEQKLPWIVDSAGTSGWHKGEQPDQRSINICNINGVDITNQRSRQLQTADFNDFNMIIAMDDQNFKDIQNQAPENMKNKIYRMMDFLPARKSEVVPDPYYDNRFSEVFQLLDEVVKSSIPQIQNIFLKP